MLGSIGAWFFEDIVGIRQPTAAGEGWGNITIWPQLSAYLANVTGRVDAAGGIIEVVWTNVHCVSNGAWELTLSLPTQTTGTVVFDGSFCTTQTPQTPFTILEGDTLVFNSSFVPGTPGIINGKQLSTGEVVLTVTSGRYKFFVN